MNVRSSWSVALILFVACSEPAAPPQHFEAGAVVSAAGVAFVSTNADDGPGSLRQAIAEANLDPSISTIRVGSGLGVIALRTPLTYAGTQPLAVLGAQVVIDGLGLNAGESALRATGGGSIDLRRLTLRNAPASGLLVDVPGGSTGTVRVSLHDVSVQNNGAHGVIVNDQTFYFRDPNSPLPDGSDASLDVQVVNSRFDDNGNGSLDQDGLRVNEGGFGSIDAVIVGSTFRGAGADGLELDERGQGDAIATLRQTQLVSNGAFSTVDPDDGIDVDEVGDGDIRVSFVDVVASDNSEQGIDLNENDAGDLRATMTRVEGSRNGEEGIEFEEDDDFQGGGDIVATLTQITTNDNGGIGGDAGLKLREKGNGDVHAEIVIATASDNIGLDGILVREDSDGLLDALVLQATALANGDHGVRFDENGAGDLRARVLSSTAQNNGGSGVRGEQQLAGAGMLRVHALTGGGNVGGDATVDAGVTLTP